MPELYTRYEDTTPTICNRCGWKGLAKNTIHDYRDDGCGDVEAVDECPECGSDDLDDYHKKS